MAVRSRLLAHGLGVLAVGHRDVLVVPAGRTAVVRWFQCVNRSGAAQLVVWGIRRGSTVASILASPSLADGAELGVTSADLALSPGDALTLYVQAAGGSTPAFHYTVAGSLLEGEPA